MNANAKPMVKKSLTDKKNELVNKENKTIFNVF